MSNAGLSTGVVRRPFQGDRSALLFNFYRKPFLKFKNVPEWAALSHYMQVFLVISDNFDAIANQLSSMRSKVFRFSSAAVQYFGNAPFNDLAQIIGRKDAILLTDENVMDAHAAQLGTWRSIVIPAGERYKQQSTIDRIIGELIVLEADRNTTLIGVGGGVVTDMAGYVASIYMRGIDCAYVPTSLLNLVDASIGGKTGIDIGLYKNMLGTFKQPKFIYQDLDLLKTLPEAEWINGFAEIIKHACIKDKDLFVHLQENNVASFKKEKSLLAALIEKNIQQKFEIVLRDEFERSERKLLNFGHTIGHAVENLYCIPHGQAVAIGMCMAAYISKRELGFQQTEQLQQLLRQYQLPTSIPIDAEKVFSLLKMDKKRTSGIIDLILLEKLGTAVIKPITLEKLKKYLFEIERNSHESNN